MGWGGKAASRGNAPENERERFQILWPGQERALSTKRRKSSDSPLAATTLLASFLAPQTPSTSRFPPSSFLSEALALSPSDSLELATSTHPARLSNLQLARLHWKSETSALWAEKLFCLLRPSRTLQLAVPQLPIPPLRGPPKTSPRRRRQSLIDQQGAELVPPAEADPR